MSANGKNKSTLDWIGKNLSPGGLIRNAGSGLGFVIKHSASAAGAAAEYLVDEAQAKKIKEKSSLLGDATDRNLTKYSAIAGEGVNFGIRKIGDGSGYVAGRVAKAAGAQDKTVENVEKFGSVAGVVTLGFITGSVLSDAAILAAAAEGTAGAAATTSGLAALGGGSLAAGGGGMAAGAIVADSILVGATASTASIYAENVLATEDAETGNS